MKTCKKRQKYVGKTKSYLNKKKRKKKRGVR